jgi:hypothetical protein
MKLRALAVALLATALVFVWQASTVHYNYAGNWTGLFCTGASLPVPPELEARTIRSIHQIGYDGQFYRYIAHDPFFRKEYAQYVDDARLRYPRILVPMLAYALAGGRQSIIDYTFVLAILASVFAGCYWCSCYCLLYGKSEWWGLIFLLVPATLASMDRMLVDATLAALFAGFLLYAERRDRWRLYIVCILACLTRDTGIFLGAAIALAALLDRDFKRMVLFATAALPALAWWSFVSLHTRPSTAASQIAAFPLVGHLKRLFLLREVSDPLTQSILRITDVISLIGLLICLGLAAYWIIPERIREIQICVGLFVILGLVLGAPGHLIEPYGYARPVSPLLLFLMLRGIARGSKAGLVAPLSLSLGVGVNLLSQAAGVAKGLLR